MKRELLVLARYSIMTLFIIELMIMVSETAAGDRTSIPLPEPQYDSSCSVERALSQRRSHRAYLNEPLSLAEVSQLLWAAQGISDPEGFRTAPSAGALYPLELYLIAGNVDGLSSAVYKYAPQEHELIPVLPGDVRTSLAVAALGQDWVKNGAIVIVFTAVYERTTRKYGERGIRYVHMEVGYAAQNVYLQAVSLKLGTVFVGAFYDDEVKKLLNLRKNEIPLGLMPVGVIPWRPAPSSMQRRAKRTSALRSNSAH